MSATSDAGRAAPSWLSPLWGPPPVAGMTSLRGDAGQPFRHTQQIERAVHLGQVPLRDMEIPGGRIDSAVAEQELDGVQIHPGFQQMRGKTMPEGMNAFAVGEPPAALPEVVAPEHP